MVRSLYCLALAALATAVPAFPQSDGAATAQARIEELEQRIAKLEERLRRIEAEPSATAEPPQPEVVEKEEPTDQSRRRRFPSRNPAAGNRRGAD